MSVIQLQINDDVNSRKSSRPTPRVEDETPMNFDDKDDDF